MAAANITSTVNIASSATNEVDNDVLKIRLSRSDSDKDANVLQERLRKAVNDALVILKGSDDPELVITTEAFNVNTRFDKNGKITGFNGTAVVSIKGKDTALVAGLASKVKTLTIDGTENSVSRELKQSLEADLIEQAIKSFNERAQQVTDLFGYEKYSIFTVNVQTNDRGYYAGGGMKMMAATASLAGGAPDALEVSAGKTAITVMVNGSIALDKKK